MHELRNELRNAVQHSRI